MGGGRISRTFQSEWDRRSLEALREPLESGSVQIARAAMQVEFPARPLLVTAMNPCPCGWAGDASGRCDCPSDAIARYQSRVSGPLLDRIDLHVALPRVPSAELLRRGGAAGDGFAGTATSLGTVADVGESSAQVRARVVAARERQLSRQGKPNAHLDANALQAVVAMTPAARALLERAADRLALSARAVHRVLRVARTIADLADHAAVDVAEMAEAIGFRGPSANAATAPGAGHAATPSPRVTLRASTPSEPAALHGVAGSY